MNNNRRKQLKEAIILISKAQEIVHSVKEEEQDTRDNLPDSLQDSDKANLMNEYVDALEETDANFDDLIESIKEVIG